MISYCKLARNSGYDPSEFAHWYRWAWRRVSASGRGNSRPDYTPAMCGFDRFIDYGKADFVGHDAALADHETKPEHQLVALEIDSSDADAWGYEPIWYKDEYAGFVTSGAYGHTVEKSLALAYLKTPFLELSNEEFSVHIVDQQRPARILTESPHDPSGSRMRG